MRVRTHISYANVMATVAVCVALGGTSYAALTLPRNSVGSKQLKSGAVKSSDVKNNSLRLRDFRRSDRPTGATGPAGPAGAAGARGPAGANGTNGADGRDGTVGRVIVKRTDAVLNDNSSAFAEATCPDGTRLISGGASVLTTNADDIQLVVSRPGPGSYVPLDGDVAGETTGFSQTWRAGYRNIAGGTAATDIRAFALCGEIPPAR